MAAGETLLASGFLVPAIRYPTVARGASLELVISLAGASVSARAVALTDGDAGDVTSFRVTRTGKTVLARIESSQRATVVER
jgi:flagella basal body P-ring formation protein FlgA